MHKIQSGRASAAGRSTITIADRMANIADRGGFKYIDVTQHKRIQMLDIGMGNPVVADFIGQTVKQYHQARTVSLANKFGNKKAGK